MDLQDLKYDAIISFGLPYEPEDSQYGESPVKVPCSCPPSILAVYCG